MGRGTTDTSVSSKNVNHSHKPLLVKYFQLDKTRPRSTLTIEVQRGLLLKFTFQCKEGSLEPADSGLMEVSFGP